MYMFPLETTTTTTTTTTTATTTTAATATATTATTITTTTTREVSADDNERGGESQEALVLKVENGNNTKSLSGSEDDAGF